MQGQTSLTLTRMQKTGGYPAGINHGGCAGRAETYEAKQMSLHLLRILKHYRRSSNILLDRKKNKIKGKQKQRNKNLSTKRNKADHTGKPFGSQIQDVFTGKSFGSNPCCVLWEHQWLGTDCTISGYFPINSSHVSEKKGKTPSQNTSILCFFFGTCTIREH